MSKFTIKYEVEALTLNDALQTAYEIVFLASADVDSVKVEPVEKQKSDLTFADVPTETNPSVYERVVMDNTDIPSWNKSRTTYPPKTFTFGGNGVIDTPKVT